MHNQTRTCSTDYIFVRDLSIEMSAGIYDHEKSHKQRVIFYLRIGVQSNKDRDLSSIQDVASYEDVVNTIIKITNAKHYDLLEELAELIASNILAMQFVDNVQIVIEKPDIIKQTRSVGIEIFRSNT